MGVVLPLEAAEAYSAIIPRSQSKFRSVTSVLGSGWIAWHYRTSLCSGIERGNLSARFGVLYQIDKLSDQSASDEERQQRKRRLCGAVAVDDLAKPSSRASSRPDSTTAEPPRRADYHQRAGIVEIQGAKVARQDLNCAYAARTCSSPRVSCSGCLTNSSTVMASISQARTISL